MPTISTSGALTDTASSKTVSGTKTFANYVVAEIRINGTTVASAPYYTDGTSYSVNISITSGIRSLIYDYAEGHTLTNAVTIVVTEYTDAEAFVSLDSVTGTLTIAARLSGFSSSTANPYNLDSPTNISTSWARPHTAFRGKLVTRVNGTIVFTRYGFGTSAVFNPTSYAGYLDAMISAMGGVSPRTISFELVTEFNANVIVDLVSVGSGIFITNTNGVIKSFLTASTVSTSSIDFNLDPGASLAIAISRMDSSLTHTVELQYNPGTWTTLMTQTGVATSTTFSLGSGELTTLYNAFTTTVSVPIRIALTTWNGGTQVGSTNTAKTGTATIINCTPTLGTCTYTDLNTTIQTLLGTTTPHTLLQAKSTPRITTGTTTVLKSATVVSYRVRHGATDTTVASTATSGVNIDVSAANINFSSNTVVYVDVIDSRGLIGTSNLTLTIVPYSAPARTVALAYRNNNYDAQSYAEIAWNVQRIIVSSVEKNTGYARWRVKPVGGAYGGYTSITDTATTSGDRRNYSRTSSDGGTVNIGSLSQNTAYVVELSTWDSVNTTPVTVELTIQVATPVVQYVADGLKIMGQYVWEMIYPVGAIYMSVVSTSPATLFGGTWVALGGQFLIGADGTYTAGSTGGAATVTLTEAQMPSHTHIQNSHIHSIQKAWINVQGDTRFTGASGFYASAPTSTNTDGTVAVNQTAGSGQAHPNMPPYLAVYMWKRTA